MSKFSCFLLKSDNNSIIIFFPFFNMVADDYTWLDDEDDDDVETSVEDLLDEDVSDEAPMGGEEEDW
ncbi:hypothetical protein KJ652_06935 [Patescibacteria group bacterium]|nr:hypothetical protein [Patescibacteria group bacterium]MBU1124284.1 hypothetical protein [Patescibacteria group bacterium]